MMQFQRQLRLKAMISLMSLTSIPVGIALKGKTQPTCSASSEPPKTQLQPIWDRLNQAPFFELHHHSHNLSEGNISGGIEQYARPDRYRRFSYNSEVEQYRRFFSDPDMPPQALAAGIEEIVVNDLIYLRLRDEWERVRKSDPVAFHLRQPYLGKYFPGSTITDFKITGPVVLPSGQSTCVYSYQSQSRNSSDKLTEDSTTTLWVDIETGDLRQMQTKFTNLRLTPPSILESKTIVSYPESITIELPTQPQLSSPTN